MTTKKIIGGILILLGIGFLLDTLGVLPFEFSFFHIVGRLWPLILIYLGVKILYGGSFFGGSVLLILGVVLQIDAFAAFDAWSVFWPLFVILLGASFFLDQKKIRSDNRSINEAPEVSSQDYINESVTFAALNKKIISNNFHGGKVNVTFGGAEIDLSGCELASGGAQLNLNCDFGGIKIIVPKNIRVESNGKATLAGWDNKFSGKSSKDAPKLEITGSATFGGVEVVNG
jgi:predicted membrane protein